MCQQVFENQTYQVSIGTSLVSRTWCEVWSIVERQVFGDWGKYICVIRYAQAGNFLIRHIEFNFLAEYLRFRYLSQKQLDRENQHKFITNEWLRREYLNQTFNFLPDRLVTYNETALNPTFEDYQERIMQEDIYLTQGKIEVYRILALIDSL